MNAIMKHAVEVIDSCDELKDATQHFLGAMRASQSLERLHRAAEALGEALQGATEAQRALVLVLALDPDDLTADGPLVPPLLEHKECECATGERTPLNCWNCSAR